MRATFFFFFLVGFPGHMRVDILIYFWASHDTVQEFLKMRGINTKYVHNLDETIRAEGLIDIAKDHRSVPLGWGPKEIAIPAAEVRPREPIVFLLYHTNRTLTFIPFCLRLFFLSHGRTSP